MNVGFEGVAKLEAVSSNGLRLVGGTCKPKKWQKNVATDSPKKTGKIRKINDSEKSIFFWVIYLFAFFRKQKKFTHLLYHLFGVLLVYDINNSGVALLLSERGFHKQNVGMERNVRRFFFVQSTDDKKKTP